MSRRKQHPAPPPVDDISTALAGRYHTPDPTPAETPTPPPGRKEPKPAAVAGVLSRPATRMVTRSWYLPAEVAEELDVAADRVAAGLPGVTKHQALAALLRAGIAQADQVRAELAAQLRGQLGL